MSLIGKVSNVVRRVFHAGEVSTARKALEATTHGAKVNAGDVTFIPGAEIRYVESPVSARYAGGGTNVARLKRLELPEGQSLDVFLPEVKHTKDAFAVIASAEGGNSDAMLLLSDRFISKSKTLESGAITGQLDKTCSEAELKGLWSRVQNLREMAMKLLAESAKRGNDKAQTRLMELISQQGRK